MLNIPDALMLCLSIKFQSSAVMQLNIPPSLSWLEEVGFLVPVLDMANHASKSTATASFTIDYTGSHLPKDLGKCVGLFLAQVLAGDAQALHACPRMCRSRKWRYVQCST